MAKKDAIDRKIQKEGELMLMKDIPFKHSKLQ